MIYKKYILLKKKKKIFNLNLNFFLPQKFEKMKSEEMDY